MKINKLNVVLCVFIIILLIFSFYQYKQLKIAKINSGMIYFKNLKTLEQTTSDILNYIKAGELDSDRLLMYAGISDSFISIAQSLKLAPIEAYYYNIKNRLINLNNSIENQESYDSLVTQKEELLIILQTLQEGYKLIENKNEPDIISWYDDFNEPKGNFYFQIFDYFNKKAQENETLNIH